MTSQKLIDSSRKRALNPDTTEQVVLLRRPVFWSYIFASLFVGASISFGAWAAIARFDQMVSATGMLELKDPAMEIKAPATGVVQGLRVKDGSPVQKDETLATFQPTISKTDLESLNKQKEALTRQNQLYEKVLKGGNPVNESYSTVLTQLRADLVKENQYYQELIKNKNLDGQVSSEFNPNQQKLLAASSPELQSRASASLLQIQELEKQLLQVKETGTTAQKPLPINQDILDPWTQASKEAGVSRQQYQRHKLEVLSNRVGVDKLKTAQQKITGKIDQARENLQQAIAVSKSDVFTKITQNQKRIAQIDFQLKQVQLQNQRGIIEIDAKLSRLAQPQQLKSPFEGVVFDLQPSAPGAVVNANQSLLTIVPNDSLVASVFLNNQDIGAIKPGMDITLKMASVPKKELGSVEGKVVAVSSIVLPPVPGRPYYAIPAKIQLKRPFLDVNGKPVRLQAGTSVSCNLSVPQKRTVLDVVQDEFKKKVQSAVK